MGLFKNWVSKKKYDEVVMENNRLKFDVKELERAVKSLKESLDKVEPRITALTSRMSEMQRYIDKYHIEITEDKEKWKKHHEIDKPKKKKNKEESD